jgi:hypothetical protein
MHTVTQTTVASQLLANGRDRVVTVGANDLHLCRRIAVRLYPGRPAQALECPLADKRCQWHAPMGRDLTFRRCDVITPAITSDRLRPTSRGGSRRPGSSG